jgi:chemotaxis protein histidine kinase CheA
MSWLDELFGGGTTGGVDTVASFTPRQLQWFASHGIDPRTLSPAQQQIAVQTMNSQFATEDTQAKALADQQAQAQAAAQAKAQADAVAAAQAKAEADAAAAQRAAEEQARQAQPVTPAPVPTPPPTVDTAPDATTKVVETNTPPPTNLSPDDINRMISDAVNNALQTERTNVASTTATQKAAEDAAATANTQRLANLRDATKSGATSGVQAYFKSRGVDPTQYGSSIDAAIAQALGNISPTDETPSARVDVTGLASGLFNDAESARRASLTGQIQQMFPETFANTQVGNNLDDDLINQVLGGQRSQADAIINNMLTRGVITPTGASAARHDLDSQTPLATTRLNQIGGDLLSSERNSINDIISRANKTASTVSLGGSFDPTSYKNEVDQSFNDFVNSLGTKFKAAVPGNLFTTSGLGAIAGSAQGAGNTKFNPNALAGVLEQQTADANNPTNTNTNSRVTDFVF